MAKNEELPNNLRLGTMGQIYCADDQNPLVYIQNSPIYKMHREKDFPLEVVLVSRKDFIKLCNEVARWREVSMHLIQAA